MAKSAKIERTQKEFVKAMKKKFSEDDKRPPEVYGGHSQVNEHMTLIPYMGRRGV
jgi:hypothetical protein